MKLSITGPNYCGKTTLFSLLSGIKYEAASLLQVEQKSKVTIIKVPDPRLDLLKEREGPNSEMVYPTIELYDSPGLAIPPTKPDENAQAIAALREADGIICVIRLEDGLPAEQITDAVIRQLADIRNELLIADLGIIEKRIAKLQHQTGRASTATLEQDKKEIVHLTKMQALLETEHNLDAVKTNPEINRLIKNYGIITAKPVIIIPNLSEFQLQPEIKDKFSRAMAKQYPNYVALSLKLEYELSQPEFSPEERKGFLADYNLSGPTAPEIMPLCYKALGLISFFTVGDDETRGWAVKQGETALTAAGVVHTDIARGFISAEVVPYQHWLDGGTLKNAKERGKLRLEGKSYVVHDGDCIHFKFNV